MSPRFYRRTRQTVSVLMAAVALVTATALTAGPIQAQLEDPATGTVEVTLNASVTTYTEPNPSSAVMTVLTPGTTVAKIGQQMGSDEEMWVHVADPSGADLGWMHLSDFKGGTFDVLPGPSGFFP